MVPQGLLLTFALAAGVWSGSEQRTLGQASDLAFSRGLSSLGSIYNVTLHSPLGDTNCDPTRSEPCSALVVLAGLLSERSEDTSCPYDGLKPGQCNFMCGVMTNILYHAKLVKEIPGHQMDLVVMHDESIPDDALTFIRKQGARTLKLDDSVKRLTCRGFVKSESNTARNLKADVCERPVFSGNIFGKHEVVFVQVMKLAALTLYEYDMVTHVDVDQYIVSPTHLAEELSYFHSNPKLALLANGGGKAPINAGHWVSKPDLELVKIWLEDLLVGYSRSQGYQNAGVITPKMHEHLEGGWSNEYRNKTSSWDFVGANRDQGLMFHTFVVKCADLGICDGVETSISFKALFHFVGPEKPWKVALCQDEGIENKKVQRLNSIFQKVIPPPTGEAFVDSYCTPILKQNRAECAIYPENA